MEVYLICVHRRCETVFFALVAFSNPILQTESVEVSKRLRYKGGGSWGLLPGATGQMSSGTLLLSEENAAAGCRLTTWFGGVRK